MPVFVIPPRACFVPLECSEGIKPTYAIKPRADGNRRGSPNSAAIVSAVMSSMPRKQRSRWTRVRSGSQHHECVQLVFEGAQSRDRFIDRPQVGLVRLRERRQRPGLRAQPGVMPLRPRTLRRGEAAAMPQQKFREAMAGPQQIRADVLAAPQEIADRFLLSGGHMDRGQRARAVQHREVGRIAPIRFDAIAGAAGNQPRRDDVAGNPWSASARCSSKPHGPAS